MSWAADLSRDELIENAELFSKDEEFLKFGKGYLKNAVYSEDTQLIKSLLKAGVDPNIREVWGDDLLHHLVSEYAQTKSTKGKIIKDILTVLLDYGANPNNVGSNNWRALDYCIYKNEKELVDTLVRFGADPELREYI
jgi:hypothetical protein